MGEIEICIPDEVQEEIKQLNLKKGMQLSDVELYQYLIRRGLEVVDKSKP